MVHPRCMLVFLFFTFQQFHASRLQWAPFTTVKKPFITFINDLDKPTWFTKNQITKTNTMGIYKLKLVRDLPFAVICGACFSPQNRNYNISIQISNHNITTYRRLFIQTVGLNKCIDIYGFVESIHGENGKISCNLRFNNNRTFFETLSFEVVPLRNVVDIDYDSDDNINRSKTFINVWYYVNNEERIIPLYFKIRKCIFINH